jgi:RNA polymerase sigma factor for flagellar operon FliA
MAQPTETERNQLILDHMPFVRRVALKLKRKLPSEANDLEDLIQEGMVGLVLAAGRYDPALNDSFEAYAFQRVRGAMLDSLRRQHWFENTNIQMVEPLFESCDPETIHARDKHGLAVEEGNLRTAWGTPISNATAESETEELAESAKTRRALRRAERIELTHRERLIFELYYQFGKTEREIAPSLQVSESRVGQMRRGALLRLRGRCKSLGLAAA